MNNVLFNDRYAIGHEFFVKFLIWDDRADSCGKCLVDILATGENGSVWVIEHDKSRKVVMKDCYSTPSV